ncbi:MAG: DedA family protein [Peptococcaceae bacterium]|nr:DedA family protein [Peptococcaceae bacterium]
MGDLFSFLIDFVLHIDEHLGEIIAAYGFLTHLILFMIVFCETGLVVTPFLPGDSLIFAAGAFATRGDLNLMVLWFLLLFAAILGDTVNYHIGKVFGHKLVKPDSRFIKQRYIEQTERFFDRHGGKTIILARFVPFVRTFAPFVAGIGRMRYSYFLSYNALGGFAWVTLFLFLGFFFGTMPIVEKNFSLVIFAIIGISVMPPIVTWLRARFAKNKKS